ncbi:TPA: restriction endonuclease, partial [Streptococcus suis]|nr:restriction endonuclease [Streptococcus suis]
DLRYNQPNFRDLHSQKPKEKSRTEWAAELQSSLNEKRTIYQVNKVKKYLHKFNDKYRDSKSEFLDEFSAGQATQMHHMFPASDYPELSDTLENLIAITPTQHLTKAHPQNNTQQIDREYQKLLLLAKLNNIRENLEGANDLRIYDFDSFVNVLSVGFDLDINVQSGDYEALASIIETAYI